MAMKVLGGRNLPPHWKRFDRLQATAHKLLGNTKRPKGVFRFKSFEEFEQWKMNCRLNRPEHPNSSTS